MRLLRWRSAVTAFGFSVLAAGATVAGAQAAADLDVTFQATYNSCVKGTSNSDLAALSLLDHDTLVDNALPFTVNSHHRFLACFLNGLVAPGLTLVAFRDDGQHVSFTIPDQSVRIDRVTDVVKGRSRANRALTVRVYDCDVVAGKACPRVVTRIVRTNAAGRYSTDLSTAFDLRGTDSVTVTFASAHGDTWQSLQSVPYLRALIGSTLVIGALNPGQHALFRLRSAPGGSLLGTRAATGGDGGHFDVTFGTNLRAGQQLSSDFASDARVTLPGTSMSFPIAHHDQKIVARCLPNRRVLIYWASLGVGRARRTADSHGRATVELSSVEHEGFRLTHGSQVVATCQTPAGDTLERSVSVP